LLACCNGRHTSYKEGACNFIRYYILRAAIDGRVAQIDANGAVTFMHNDKQNSVIAISDTAGNPVVRRGYGTYGGEADQGEVRGTSTPPNDPAQMVGNASVGTSAPPALRAFSGSKRFPEPFCALRKPPTKPFGYTGRRWDPDLGLYYYRARWYDPTLGTFLQTDPIGALDYIYLYSYVSAEPGNGTALIIWALTASST
jgi:RHS repeat-associated protein